MCFFLLFCFSFWVCLFFFPNLVSVCACVCVCVCVRAWILTQSKRPSHTMISFQYGNGSGGSTNHATKTTKTKSTPTLFMLLLLLLLNFVLMTCLSSAHPADLDDRPILFAEEYAHYLHFEEDELVNHCMSLFESIDNGQDVTGEWNGAGGNGEICIGELALRLLRVEVERQELDTAYHFRKWDMDDDNLLTMNEIPEHTDRSRALFTFADLNKDGWLSEAEGPRYFHPETMPSMFRFLATEAMMAFDTNGDGHLDRKECHEVDDHLHKLPHPEHKIMSIIGHHFDSAERGEPNGKLSVVEIMHYLEDRHHDRIMTHARELIEAADDNQNGSLCRDEIRKHYSLFVGHNPKMREDPHKDKHWHRDGHRHRPLKGMPKKRPSGSRAERRVDREEL